MDVKAGRSDRAACRCDGDACWCDDFDVARTKINLAPTFVELAPTCVELALNKYRDRTDDVSEGFYSSRSVLMGCMKAAREAGMSAANVATPRTTATTLAIVIGSNGETP